MGSILSLAVILLTFVTVAVDSISYPGFFGKYLLLDSRLMVFVSLILLTILSFVKTSKPSKVLSKLYTLNSRVILPILAVATIGLTALEYARYPNFVFTTLHIQYIHLGYGLLLSAAIYLFTLRKTSSKLSGKSYLFIWLSLYLLFMGLLINTSQNYIFPALSLEDGVFEWLEVLFFFGASVMTFIQTVKSYKKKDLLSAVLFAGLTVVFFFIAGEEISWGQRIFGVATPDTVRQVNEQGETTLHNLRGIQEKRDLFYIVFSSYFAFAWTIISLIPKRLKKFISPWYLTLFFLPMFFITLTGQFQTLWQEYGELTLSVGVFLYALETGRKFK